MRTILFTILAVFVSLPLVAQTGLCEISYGDKYSEAKSTLENSYLCFEETENKDGVVVFTPDPDDYEFYSEYYIDHVTLFFDTEIDQLVAWQMFYYIPNNEAQAVENYVFDDVNALYGDEFDWDNDHKCWYWEFDKGRALYIGAWGDEYYVADYYNADYPACSVLIY